MATIYVTDGEGKEHVLAADSGSSVMEVLRRSSVPIMAICGGDRSCATCHVYVEPDWAGRLKPPPEDEMELVSTSDYYRENLSRLSCQIRLTPDLDGLRLTVAPDA